MHDNVLNILRHTYRTIPSTGPVLEIGSININGSAREVYGHLTPYVGIDIVSGPNVDLVVDITNPLFNRWEYPELHHDFQTILCTEVLEHTPPAPLICAILTHFCMQPDSSYTLIMTCAGPARKSHSADGAPTLKAGEYYKNVDPLELSELLYMAIPGLSTRKVTVWTSIDSTDVYAVAQYYKIV